MRCPKAASLFFAGLIACTFSMTASAEDPAGGPVLNTHPYTGHAGRSVGMIIQSGYNDASGRCVGMIIESRGKGQSDRNVGMIIESFCKSPVQERRVGMIIESRCEGQTALQVVNGPLEVVFGILSNW